MIRRIGFAALLLFACRQTTVGVDADANADANAHADANADADAHADASADAGLMADEAVGPLLTRLSETPGDFPSENYVTNETSLLHVAPLLRSPELHGRAYVGVGPEQNYTYVGLLEPKVAYIVDIRRNNLLEHMVFRSSFEAGANRAAFLSALLSRNGNLDIGKADGLAELDSAFHRIPADATLRESGIARTKALMTRLAIAHSAADDKMIARIHEAFAIHGLSIAYTMLNSQRKYPTLAENFDARDARGAPASFLGTEATYQRVRKLVMENRVLPIVGDFGGKQALHAVADDMKARGLTLGVFYTSNVEQYLFEQKTYGNFTSSVEAMPRDADSQMIRVWFDQGHPHPAQQKGHRTTQLAIGADAFLERATKKPFRSYWEVVTQPAE